MSSFEEDIMPVQIILDKPGAAVTFPHQQWDKNPERARQIAALVEAAPALLAAARRGVAALEANGAPNCEAAKELRAAIDKAYGGK
jgi:hypothetical protein